MTTETQSQNPANYAISDLTSSWHRGVQIGDLVYCRRRSTIQFVADRIGHFWQHVALVVERDDVLHVSEFGPKGLGTRRLDDLTNRYQAIAVQRPYYHDGCLESICELAVSADLEAQKYSNTVAGLLALRTFAADRTHLHTGRTRATLDALVQHVRFTHNSTVCSTYVIDAVAGGCPGCGVMAIAPRLFTSAVLPQDVFDAVQAQTIGVFASGRTREIAERYRDLARSAQTAQTKGDHHVG